MSFTLQQSQLLSPLLGDKDVMELLSVEADIAAMLEFEVALAAAQAELGFIPEDSAFSIADASKTFAVNIANLSEGVARDGMAVPALVAQLKAKLGKNVHYGATSQDAIDTSLMMRAKKIFDILLVRMTAVLNSLDKATSTFGTKKLMARTRMQQALPFTVADRIETWRTGLLDAQAALNNCHFLLQFGGPIGVLGEFGESGAALKSAIALRLDLETLPHNWHSARAPILALANAASVVTGTLGKLGVDCCLMAQNEVAEITFADGGGSSAMSHKQNPVKAEALVTLARFNATLISGLHQSMVHEQERSGAAWGLEWMLLPQMIVAAGAASRVSGELLASIKAMGHT